MGIKGRFSHITVIIDAWGTKAKQKTRRHTKTFVTASSSQILAPSDEISRDTVLKNDNDKNPQGAQAVSQRQSYRRSSSNSLKTMVTQDLGPGLPEL